MAQTRRMQNKVGVVTGAGTGIGCGIALELSRLGASVVVHYNTSAEGALQTVRQIEATGGRAVPIQASLEDVSECIRLVKQTLQEFGGIDILVNNAALSTESRFFDVSEEMWNRIINVNLRAPFFCTQAAAREMMRYRGGKVVNIGSVHGFASLPVFTAYAASKGGLQMLTRQLATELAPHHINVNCVAPGLIEVERYLTQYPNYSREKTGQTVPWGRVGFPTDIAPLVGFLCSGEAEFITGQVIYVDGGQTSLLALARSSEPNSI